MTNSRDAANVSRRRPAKPWKRVPQATEISGSTLEPRLDPEIDPIYQGFNRENRDIKKSLFANYRAELTLNRMLKLYNGQCKDQVIGIRHGQRHLLRSYQRLQSRKEMIERSRSAPMQFDRNSDDDDEEPEPERPLTTVHLFGTDIKTRPLSANIHAINTIAMVNKPEYPDDGADDNDSERSRGVQPIASPPYSDGRRPEPPNNVNRPVEVHQTEKRPKSAKKRSATRPGAGKSISRPQSGVFITQRLSTPERFASVISRPRSHHYRKTPSAFDVIAQERDIDPYALPGDVDKSRFINSTYYRKTKSPRLRDHVSNEVALLFRQMKIKV